MLSRKIEKLISDHLCSGADGILLIEGARGVGKTTSVRRACSEMFDDIIEINLLTDLNGRRTFAEMHSAEDFYLKLSLTAGDRLKSREDTLIFLDDIQACPNAADILEQLSSDGKFTFIACGSGIQASDVSPAVRRVKMYPLDFEEFLYANGIYEIAVEAMQKKFERLEPLDVSEHEKIMDLFQRYLFVGGMPYAVTTYLKMRNIQAVRRAQTEISDLYRSAAGEHDRSAHTKSRRIFDLIPENMRRRKKRVRVREIGNRVGAAFSDYREDFKYLETAGIALGCHALSDDPSSDCFAKDMLKLYPNDVGILSAVLYGNNIRAIYDDRRSVELGSLYECAAACELAAHGRRLFYYDVRNKGECDLVAQDEEGKYIPLRVKSGKDRVVYSAAGNLLANKSLDTGSSYVLSNDREIRVRSGICYIPVYCIMFI